MEKRELGLVEIKARIAAKRVALGLATFKRTPTRPAQLGDLPCVFMLEGVDDIFKRASRNQFGYPLHRSLEVVIELVVNKTITTDIKNLFRDLRKSTFTIIDSDPVEYSPIVADNVFIRESRTEGPIGYGLPDIRSGRRRFHRRRGNGPVYLPPYCGLPRKRQPGTGRS